MTVSDLLQRSSRLQRRARPRIARSSLLNQSNASLVPDAVHEVLPVSHDFVNRKLGSADRSRRRSKGTEQVLLNQHENEVTKGGKDQAERAETLVVDDQLDGQSGFEYAGVIGELMPHRAQR